jgi:ABC-2 type transport system permease protein
VKGILLIARVHLITAFRERVTLFWFLLFPMFLLVVLTLIFSGLGNGGSTNFSVAIVNMGPSTGGATDFAALVESVFDRAATPSEPGKEPLFSLVKPAPDEDKDAFIEREQKAVRLGNLAAVVVIPPDFNQQLMQSIAGTGAGDASVNKIVVYQDEANAGSQMATSIIKQIISGIDREILARTGKFDEQKDIPTDTIWIGNASGELPYVDFLLPGIILMGFFVTGLFGVPGAILFARDRQILRRYWVTPLTTPRYLAGFALGHVGLCVVQFFFLYILGRFAFGASVNFAQPAPILFLLLGSVTFLAFGFFIASLAKTPNAGMAIANILNMPMMFLGGLFFPVGGLPLVLRIIVFINPLTYLSDGLRMSLGVEAGTFSLPMTVGVPLAWILVCVLVASRRLKWDVER